MVTYALSAPLILKQAGFSSGADRDAGRRRRVLGAAGCWRRADFGSPRRTLHDDVDQHDIDGPGVRADRDGDVARMFAAATSSSGCRGDR